MRIIPAIDIIDGKCVRLHKGDYDTKKVYYENPVEVAKLFEDHGLKYLHLVDLDGAKSQGIVNYKILEAICSQTNLIVDFGGGIKSDQDVAVAFESGAHQITGGTVAVKKPELFQQWLKHYGPERILLGADSRERIIATAGWQASSGLDVVDFIKDYSKKGIKYVICTDIMRDGMLLGPSKELYQEIIQKTAVELIASGGVSCLEDLIALKEIGCEGAIVGKAFYEGKITLQQMRELC